MNAIEKLLNEAKAKAGITSDNALAIEIGITRASICDYRKKRSTPDIFVMSRLADLTGRPIEQVIALVEIEKEQPEEKRKYWENFYKRLGGVAASILAVVTLIMTLPAYNADAATILTPNTVYYVKYCYSV